MFWVGKILSLVAIAVCILLVCLFFRDKKSLPLCLSYCGLLVLYAATYVAQWLGVPDMELFQNIVGGVLSISVFAGFLMYETNFKKLFNIIGHKFHKTEEINYSEEEMRETVQAIVTACQSLSKSRTGALIVIVRGRIDKYILDSGVKLDAIVSAPLMESIFNTKCPMHDGAVIIEGTKIKAAGCFLPLTKSLDIDKNLGTRHRAGLGVTESEKSDVVSIIISEETGIISMAAEGVLRRYLTPERLFDSLYDPFRKKMEQNSGKHKKHNN